MEMKELKGSNITEYHLEFKKNSIDGIKLCILFADYIIEPNRITHIRIPKAHDGATKSTDTDVI